MLDLRFVKENSKLIEKAAADKGVKIDIKKLLENEQKYHEAHVSVQNLRQERNKIAKARDIEKGREIKEKLDKEESRLQEYEKALATQLKNIPNPSKADVKIGKDESENEIIRKFKEPTKFKFKPKDHLALGEALNIIDVDRAAKVSGARFYYLKNEGVLLELALARYAIETLMKEGFTPVLPPVLIKNETMQGLGYMENGGDEDMYRLKEDGLVLVGTAEQSLVPLHMNETLHLDELPKRYVGYSSSFRREAGSYGKDTHGILRDHQFNKVEMVSFVAQGEDDKEHEFLLSLEEKFFKSLEIPYQVIKMCTGDLGFPAARKYDIEAWMPGQDKYREVTSCSTVTDFQSRRLNMKYQDGNDKKFLNVLNGTGFAMSRTIIAILENYQQEDGTIRVPEVLQKYVGKEIIK